MSRVQRQKKAASLVVVPEDARLEFVRLCAKKNTTTFTTGGDFCVEGGGKGFEKTVLSSQQGPEDFGAHFGKEKEEEADHKKDDDDDEREQHNKKKTWIPYGTAGFRCDETAMDPSTKEVNNSNSFVFLDIGMGNKKGRVVFELFDDVRTPP